MSYLGEDHFVPSCPDNGEREDVCARSCLVSTGKTSLTHLNAKGKILGSYEMVEMDGVKESRDQYM